MYQLARLLVVGGFAAALLTVPAPASEAAALTCGGKRVTIGGTNGDDTLIGTNRADVIHARGGDDRVRGRGGDDLVCGGYGSDRLWGGDGDDRVYGGHDRMHVETDGPDRSVGRIGDTLDGGAGDDLLDGGVDLRAAEPGAIRPDILSWASSPHGVRLDVPTRRATGNGADRWAAGTVELWLTEHDDRAIGGDGDDRIGTGAGDDVIRGGDGDDWLEADGPIEVIGDGGDDRVYAGGGDDEVRASRGTDELRGKAGDDFMSDPGVGRMWGGEGDDELVALLVRASGQLHDGGPGRDKLRHSHGRLLEGGTWQMGTGVMVLDGGTRVSATGFERADLAWGRWVVDGTGGPDLLEAGDGETTFRGHGGDDTFIGSPFDDWFDGGEGIDTAMFMRQGDDTCIAVEFVPADCEHVSP